jgi:hypothetical protein
MMMMMMMITSAQISLLICIRIIYNFTRKTHEAKALALTLLFYYMQRHGEYTIKSYLI